MGKKADLSLQKKQAIRTLLLTGLSYRSVVEATKRQYNFDVSKSSVEKIAKEPNLVGSGNRTGKCGRRKKLSKRDVILQRQQWLALWLHSTHSTFVQSVQYTRVTYIVASYVSKQVG